MNKSRSLKACFILIIGKAVLPSLSRSSEARLSSWFENITYRTDKLFSVKSLSDIQGFVRKREKLRVLGTRHYFNTIADTDAEFLSLRALDQVIDLNPTARTVTIESRISYRQLCIYLYTYGWAR